MTPKSASQELSMYKYALSIMVAIAASTAGLSALAGDPGNRACKLFTATMAQNILGGPVKESSRNSQADMVQGQTWVSHAGYELTGGNKSEISVLIRHAATKEEARDVFDKSKGTFNGVDVFGIGESAYRTTNPPQLFVLKGSDWLLIACGTQTAPSPAGQETVARLLLPKVGK